MVPNVAGLRSPGIALINCPDASPPSRCATAIIVGVGRSGTSMVAACLQELGLYLGAKIDNAVYEDVEIAAALEAKRVDDLARLIAERDSLHSIWGFKRPMAFKLIGEFIHLFRNPRFVVTFRDPVAIAGRNSISMHHDFLQALRLAGAQSQDLIKFVSTIEQPAMLLSYEKALLDPVSFAKMLALFCGIEAREARIKRAAGQVSNGPPHYLQASRLHFEGYLDRVDNGIAFGWARCLGQTKPLTIVIFKDGEEIGRGIANQYRADLEKHGKEGGYCAFLIHLSDPSARQAEIVAKIAGTTFSLKVPREIGYS